MKEKLKIIAIVVGVIAAVVALCFFIPVRSIEIDDLSNEEIYVPDTYLILTEDGLQVSRICA